MALWWTASAAAALQVVPQFAGDLVLTQIDPPRSGLVAQMAFSTDGSKLFVARYETGVFGYDYDPNSGLSNQQLIWSNPASNPEGGIRGSLGVAVHHDSVLGQDVLYFNEAVVFIPGHPSTLNRRIQSVRRMTDNDGDGNWGEASEVNQAILNNVQVTTHHEINNMQVRGDSLLMAIGTQSEPGNNETAYTGTISWIEDLTQLAGDTTTPNIAGFDTPPGNGQGADGYHVDERAFTSTDPGKLRVFSAGLRNPFGLAIEGANSDGDPFVTMNQTGPTAPQGNQPDQLYHSFQFADHGFEKFYQTDGNLQNGLDRVQGTDVAIDPARDNLTDWRQNAAALAAGHFNTANLSSSTADLGFNTSSNGFDIWYPDEEITGPTADLVRGAAIITRLGARDVVAANPDTGAVTQILSNGSSVLSATRTPDRTMLIGTAGGIFRLEIIDGGEEPQPPLHPVIFAEEFDSFFAPAQNFNGGQFESGLTVAFGGNAPRWNDSGGNSIHAVDHANLYPDVTYPRDFAPMIWHDNVLTTISPIAASNREGQTYTLDFQASPAVYQVASQATSAADGLLIQVLRGDNSVLASYEYLPGTWAGDIALAGDSFQYVGDGSGDVRLRVGPSNFGSGRFGGAVDNLSLSLFIELPGDYNDDGVVDAADYPVWRDHLGALAGTLPNDSDGGTIGVAQYDTWKSNFGATSNGASLVDDVPESESIAIASLCFVAGAALSIGRG
ncbi:MAG: hypothetical protein WD851_12300 [Pirellulales bacterium]